MANGGENAILQSPPSDNPGGFNINGQLGNQMDQNIITLMPG